jgi:hypothetical protein
MGDGWEENGEEGKREIVWIRIGLILRGGDKYGRGEKGELGWEEREGSGGMK